MSYFISRISWRWEFSMLFKEKFSYEKFDQSRITYAKENPWIMNYNFGHKELMERDRSYNKVI